MKKLILLSIAFLAFLSSRAQNKGVLVEFYLSAECPISKSMMPEIKAIIESFSSDSVSIQLIFCGNQHDSVLVESFLDAHDLKVSYILDSDLQVAKAKQVNVVPTVRFVDNQKLFYFGRIDDSFYKLGKRKRSQVNRDFYNFIQEWKITPCEIVKITEPIGCILY